MRLTPARNTDNNYIALQDYYSTKSVRTKRAGKVEGECNTGLLATRTRQSKADVSNDGDGHVF